MFQKINIKQLPKDIQALISRIETHATSIHPTHIVWWVDGTYNTVLNQYDLAVAAKKKMLHKK